MRASRAPTIRVNRAGGAVVAALGVLFVVLALPIAGAEVARRPADAVVAELRAGAAVDRGALSRMAAASRAALAWRPDGPGRAKLALVDLLRARRADRPVPRLEDAAAHLRASLRRNPTSPQVWARLARTRYRLGLPARDVAAALHRSLARGPYLPRLAPARAALALRLWPVLNRDGRWRRELARGWRRRPNLLTRTASAMARTGVLGRAVTHGSAGRRRDR